MTMTTAKTRRQVEYRLVRGTWARAEQLHQVCCGVGRVWAELIHVADGQREPRGTMSEHLTEWLRQSPWLHVLPARALRDAVQRLDLADKGKGAPRKRGRTDSFTVTQESDGRHRDGTRRPRPAIVGNGYLRTPKLGRFIVRRRGETSPHEAGRVLRAVVRRHAKRWTATVCYEVDAPAPAGRDAVDMNARQIATSEGVKVHMPDIARLEAPFARYQRRMARQCGPIKGKAARFETVVLEDLSVKAMTASAKGTAETPGERVAQKAGLNRVILAAGWGELRAMFEYKAKTTIAIHPPYTSQTCLRCGHVAAANRRSRALFRCLACGFEDDADCNAAKNILSGGASPVAAKGPAPPWRAVDLHADAPGPGRPARRPVDREDGASSLHASHG